MKTERLYHRAECYRLLAACFYEPDEINFKKERFLDSLIEATEKISPAAMNSCHQVGASAEMTDFNSLQVEYARLFVGPFELQAPPYGSYYLDEGGQVMGDSTMEVLQMYQKYGLKLDDDYKEMPDHITAELEFMYYLIYKEIEARKTPDLNTEKEYRAAQRIFLQGYLAEFMKKFCEKLKTSAENNYYINLADCLMNFIEADFVLVTRGSKAHNMVA